ncbi:uncharacterized protein LY89DRAFT_784082 [Mollisia scopiformis]|uniref:Heterokaryon incompatibility domain-containing protein n=1 Tax=Mollisia scopiformis TaxID=149040 RepID=A0A194X4F1_MOLSC|nr:uncharacterized protein LY89DRAFT_784082 [Mollisia scopiformis]KUJ15055.1 hypothetical protein LY89DRAFT_784082 [Mollisia scopiformis]
MNHLPLPRNPALDPVEVPYRCTEPYDGGPMLTYPHRHGWQVLYHPGGISYLVEGEKPDDRKLEAFLQNWLYFGLLSEVFGSFIDIQEFITSTKDGEHVVTTQNQEACCVSWQAQLTTSIQRARPGEPQGWEHAAKLGSHVWKVALNSKSRLKNDEVDPRIWLSICVLSESIQQVICDVVYDYDRSLSPAKDIWRTPQNPPIGEFLLEEMRVKGWCPFDIWIIDLTTKSGSLLYYYANLPPPRPHADHSKCSTEGCTAMTIDSSYRTSHSRTGCHCEEEFGDVEAVKTALSGTEIPLIQRVTEIESDSSAQFKIIEQNPSSEFVSISHVWAEGLGSYNGNSLPLCSMKRISNLVDQSFSSETNSMAFWLDTICVPIKPEEMRIRALNRLRKPYQDAKHVLVLDSYLYSQKVADMPALEAWARILICTWSRRLWTFQEARLAKDLWYQFEDVAVRMEDLFVAIDMPLSARTLQDEITIAYRGHNVLRNLGGIPEELRAEFRPEPDVWDMRESLKARSVSVKSDEALCLFCNMNLDMEMVTGLAPESRMPKFWSEVSKIPVGLIFSASEDKFTQLGLRWAPKSFMGELDSRWWYLEQCIQPRIDGHPTPDSLHAQLPSILFSSKLLIEDGSFDTLFSDNWLDLQDAHGRWYFCKMLGYWNQSRKEDPREGHLLAMLLVKPVSEFDKETTENEFDFHPGIQGVIGTVWNDGGEVPRFEGCRHAMLHRFSDAYSSLLSAVAACVEQFVEAECGWDGENDDIEEDEEDEGEQEDQSSSENQIEAALSKIEITDIDLEVEEVNDPNGDGKLGQINDEIETPATFILTQDRRERCQAFGEIYAKENIEAREICLKIGRNAERSEEASYDHFGKLARFRLQMRLRNQILVGDQTQAFIID